jgi:hypothetical protein
MSSSWQHNWSRGKSIDHSSRSLCLFSFSSLNKSRYGSLVLSNSNPSAWKAPHVLSSTIIRLKPWHPFIMNFTIAFASSKGNSYLGRRLKVPNTVTSRNWTIWVVCGAKVMTRTRASVRRAITSQHRQCDSNNYPSITWAFLQQIHPIPEIHQD